MIDLQPPPVHWRGETWSPHAIAARGARWRSSLDRLSVGRSPVGICLAPHPDTIALLVSLAVSPAPIVLLSPDTRSWRSEPELPPGTPVFVAPCVRDLLDGPVPANVRVVVPEDDDGRGARDRVPRLETPGFVFLTSGSTGGPKPVYRTLAATVRQARALNAITPLDPGAGVLSALPLSGAQGFVNSLLQAALLGAPLGLLPKVDHHAVLAAFATGRYGYVSVTPFLVSLLTRCALPPHVPRAPAIVRVAGGSVPRVQADEFQRRFGVRIQAQYGSTELGTITVARPDARDADQADVGVPVDGVDIRVGASPGEPNDPMSIGRVWVRSPWRMDGYGYPPVLAPRPDRDGWFPTEDLGTIDGRGRLRLAGRADQAFKASNGYLVSPQPIAEALVGLPGVRDAVVVPLPSPRGTLIGALVEAAGTTEDDVRRDAARVLPAWMQPHVLRLVDVLPRLPGGKPDSDAAARELEALV